MKKIKLIVLGLLLVGAFSCKEAKKEQEQSTQAQAATETYRQVQDTTKVSFTAYKTTEKLPTGTRDPKILEFFFGVMENTELISGVFNVSEDNNYFIDVTLNGNTATIPLTHKAVSDTSLVFDGVMNLEEWDALDAVASINKACEALHTGKDGVSKTWSEVAVHAEVLLQKN